MVWHVSMSLDGFIAGPGDTMDWALEGASEPSPEAMAPSPLAMEVIRTTGAILAGRRWWDVASAKYNGLDGIYGGAWSGPVFVLTHRLPEALRTLSQIEERQLHSARLFFTSASIAEAVALALEAAEDQNVVILGANVAQQCLRAGLVDELLVHVAPALLGDGVRLIEKQSVPQTRLELASLGRSGQIADMRFRVRK